MQWIDNFPQCLSYYIQVICNYVWNKFGKNKKRYQGLNELEEEEFNLGLKGQIIQNQNNQDQHQNYYYEKQKQQKDLEEVSTKLLINQQTENRQRHKIQEQQQSNPVENSQINKSSKIYDSFKINIDPLTKSKKSLANQRIIRDERIVDKCWFKYIKFDDLLNKRLNRFKIYDLIYTSMFIFVLCEFTKSYQCQTFAPLIQHHILLETVQSNLKIYNLALEKFMMLESRQFTYLKYNYGVNNQNWQICVSISPKTNYQKQIQGKQRIQGQLYSVSHITQFNETKQVRIQIKNYLQLDLKSIIKNQKVINRGLFEIKNYVNKLYDYCRQYFQEELV